ncbi:PilZ domain-containing protein [Thiomicrorhabdus aquaedulcis]|uniref:PilZ domain-containing protein n=1 Tax=Thiomicrorhabdus aquaedulcis TaxID=2211106 RepID=UPI001E28D052|nr:PilZ domain-containing protein [Thiomicrorhabdus aquaedulcis]
MRVKNSESLEEYCLEGVEVVHQRQEGERFLCGCHIAQVTSGQLLAHHRIVMTDAFSAQLSMQSSQLNEFDFIEDGSALSLDHADFQEASMALNLAVSQLQSNQAWGKTLLRELAVALNSLPNNQIDQSMLQPRAELHKVFGQFEAYYAHMSDTSVALAMLAKLLAHTPDSPTEKQAWKTLIADFESRFLTPEQQMAYDFMHQGLNADEALSMAQSYLNQVDEK